MKKNYILFIYIFGSIHLLNGQLLVDSAIIENSPKINVGKDNSNGSNGSKEAEKDAYKLGESSSNGSNSKKPNEITVASYPFKTLNIKKNLIGFQTGMRLYDFGGRNLFLPMGIKLELGIKQQFSTGFAVNYLLKLLNNKSIGYGINVMPLLNVHFYQRYNGFYIGPLVAMDYFRFRAENTAQDQEFQSLQLGLIFGFHKYIVEGFHIGLNIQPSYAIGNVTQDMHAPILYRFGLDISKNF
ncbi:MAG: hypothetical protein MUE53_05530 [Chitinophagales bacterium]|jgi:hypothetical protein|nr:hypothetical protein [Chitinophagales bacterium]